MLEEAARGPRIAFALSLTANGLRNIAGLPEAAYASVAVQATDDLWLAGGLK